MRRRMLEDKKCSRRTRPLHTQLINFWGRILATIPNFFTSCWLKFLVNAVYPEKYRLRGKNDNNLIYSWVSSLSGGGKDKNFPPSCSAKTLRTLLSSSVSGVKRADFGTVEREPLKGPASPVKQSPVQSAGITVL
ncbi:hypothetical protein LENED_005820 [Lentinula edodes]|uniref:Uncharacterized protein n=1 Tax=Lentinula edodes TaxID=5353 RepID=A0A1Q3EAE4_LENED|nr:hypothetical protein LENED_005820 [Lentinula edodes]